MSPQRDSLTNPQPTLDTEDVRLTLNQSPPTYTPGETLQATVTLPNEALAAVRNAELSVVWYTAGKGDEDLHVHELKRWVLKREQLDNAGDHASPPLATQSLNTQLPMSPLSYAGVIVKVCWCVRVRLFLVGGKQLLVEAPLQLGAVRAAAMEPADVGELGEAR